jgi:hypothetical protein
LITFAQPATLKVRKKVPEWRSDGTASLSMILAKGTKNEILEKLAVSSLQGLNITTLVQRLYRDKDLLKQATDILRSRNEYFEEVWKVGITMGDYTLCKEYIQGHVISQNVGGWFKSELLTVQPGRWIRPVNGETAFQYLEYFPLINSRAHKTKKEPTILNDRLSNQYKEFLSLIGRKVTLDAEDNLIAIIYLLTQDRIHEAKSHFQQFSKWTRYDPIKSELDHENLKGYKLQIDYLWAYLELCLEVKELTGKDSFPNLSKIQEVVKRYHNYPEERYRNLFKDIGNYVKEIIKSDEIQENDDEVDEEVTVTKAEEVEKELEGEADIPVMIDFKIDDQGVVMVRHRGVREINIEYYKIDAEIMFSSSPFTLSELGDQKNKSRTNEESSTSNSYKMLKPNAVDNHPVKIAKDSDGILMVPLLPAYWNSNIMTTISSVPPAANQAWIAHYSTSMSVQCIGQSGIVKAVSKNNGKPIRGAYVKVFAELKNGKGSEFWKDGYTDLIGRFDYANVSRSVGVSEGGFNSISRFAAYVDGGEHGCHICTLPVPPI